MKTRKYWIKVNIAKIKFPEKTDKKLREEGGYYEREN